jgi:hypothetical protein
LEPAVPGEGHDERKHGRGEWILAALRARVFCVPTPLVGIRARLHRLTDAMIDGVLEKPLFDERKSALLLEEREVKDQILAWERNAGLGLSRLEKFLELIKTPSLLYRTANQAEKGDLVRELTSNLKVSGKNVAIEPKLFVQVVVERPKSLIGSPSRGVHRTWKRILERLLKHFAGRSSNPTESEPLPFVASVTHMHRY